MDVYPFLCLFPQQTTAIKREIFFGLLREQRESTLELCLLNFALDPLQIVDVAIFDL